MDFVCKGGLLIRRSKVIASVITIALGRPILADELLYRYEADVLPYDPSAGWILGNPCDKGCSESVVEGFLQLTYPASGGSFTNYSYRIANPGVAPPKPPFWVEWRYASNNAVHGYLGGDGTFVISYNTVFLGLDMYGDAIVSDDGGTFVAGLPLNQFRTFRFETPDGNQWCVWYDGKQFMCSANNQDPGAATYVQMYGHGESPTQTINSWDYVRYGRLTTGETIVAADPSGGLLDAAMHYNLDRFTITFDQPNYVYVNDVTVEVLGNMETRQQGNDNAAASAPAVIATRRQDNGPPETVEIVLDRPLTVADGKVRFTFNTGAATPQIVEYTLVDFEPCCLPGGACESLAPADCSTQGGSPATSSCEGDLDHDGHDGACDDACASDQGKLSPGLCGCGISDIDSDLDSIPNCHDQCPGQDDRIDVNNDGIPDCLASAIPTASTWGLIIFTLLLFIAAKILQAAPASSPGNRRT